MSNYKIISQTSYKIKWVWQIPTREVLGSIPSQVLTTYCSLWEAQTSLCLAPRLPSWSKNLLQEMRWTSKVKINLICRYIYILVIAKPLTRRTDRKPSVLKNLWVLRCWRFQLDFYLIIYFAESNLSKRCETILYVPLFTSAITNQSRIFYNSLYLKNCCCQNLNRWWDFIDFPVTQLRHWQYSSRPSN